MNRDRQYLFGLAGLALLILGGIAAGAITSRIPNDSQTLLGAISAGVLLFARDIVTTIRAAWTDERTGALTDQLAGSAPADRPSGTPTDPINTKEAP